MCLPCDSRCLCVYHQNKETIRDSNSFFQGKAPKEVVPTPPSEPFFFTRVPLCGVFWAHTDPTDSTDFLMVGNLTEVGGHFRPTRISLLWVFLGLTPIQQEYSHGFRKKRFVKFVGFVVFNHPRISTNAHKFFLRYRR